MLFRNRRLVRALACYLLLQTGTSLVFPTISRAMTGPNQPEFTSYEAPGASDMVNLVTGDFSYQIPLLDVPGPERGFSLPLSYQAGIQSEQEASWVGLGWSLNPGAIARTVNGYPDDDAGGSISSRFYKEIETQTNSVMVPGIYSATTSKYNGSGGNVDLIGLIGFDWNDKKGVGGDVIGIGYQQGEGATFNPVRFAAGIATIATIGSSAVAAQTAATAAGGSSVSLGTRIAGEVGMEVVKGSAASMAMGMFGLGRLGGTTGYNNSYIDHTSGDWAYNERRIFFLNSNAEVTYGSLQFGKMSQRLADGTATPGSSMSGGTSLTVKAGATSWVPKQFKNRRRCDNDDFGNQSEETAADIYQPVDDNINYYDGRRFPISIAHDYFNVMGEGATGSIRPYRLEVGSVAYPKIGTENCYQHAKFMVVPFRDDYKVGFRYENELSNEYEYHQNGQDIGVQINPDMQSVTLTDQRLFDNTARFEKARTGLINKGSGNQQLVQGKHTVWYSNAEIEQLSANPFTGYANGFLDFAAPVADANSTNNFRHQLLPNSIGAFEVTVEDGTVYHYSLPVYNHGTYTESNEKQLSSTIGGLGKYTSGSSGYATTWLLTAITSPDYIDRNNSGTADDGDWGGWVSFQYGKFSSNFNWRQPYIGTSYTDEKSPIEYESFTQGNRENYYLNSISTRTHTALFIKSVRQDGRGYPIVRQLGDGDDAPSRLELNSSLRLDEIILLDNQTLHKLQTANGINATDESAVPAFTTDTKGNGTARDCNCGDDLAQVFDQGDLEADVRIRDYVLANCLKRVHFNYSYDLCRGAPNSFAYDYANPILPTMEPDRAAEGRGGKLTLHSVSFFGPVVGGAVTKIIPDFTFGYAVNNVPATESNPAYGKEKWDAFGMYSAAGLHTTTSHQPSTASYAAPWSLTSITSPLGGSTTIGYERDQYAAVADRGNSSLLFDSNGTAVLTLSTGQYADLSEMIKPGDFVNVEGDILYNCLACQDSRRNNTTTNTVGGLTTIHDRLEVATVSSNSVTLTQKFNLPCSCGTLDVNSAHGSLRVATPLNKIGGNIRVASITTTEPSTNAQYKVLYKYTETLGENYNSTGVLAKEPAFLNKTSIAAEGQFDYPTTPVLYKKVTVFRGPFQNGDDGQPNSKEVYTFYTPTSSMLTENLTTATTPGMWDPFNNNYAGVADLYNNQVTINTGLIGRPKAITTYNAQGQVELSSELLYSSQIANADGVPRQGYYTEGVMTNELLGMMVTQTGLREGGGPGQPRPTNGGGFLVSTTVVGHHQVNRTTKTYVPTVLTGVRSMRNDLVSSSQNVLYDFLTGQVLETAFTNSLGKIFHSRTVPAYTLPGNEGMRAKGENAANHHMLAQSGAAYAYFEIPGGPAYNPLNPLDPQTSRLISAGVRTWQSNWSNYREADANGVYQDVAGQQPVWRQAATYAWQSPLLNDDGSFKGFTPFTWTGTPDSHWLKTGETVRYDHYSHALESRNVNGHYAAQKTGYGQTQVTVSGTNARYTELAYSGAEDALPVGGATHFGGEVVAGDGGKLDNQLAHTGFYSYQAAPGQKGFVYRAQIGRDVDAGKTYRVNAWAHASALNGKLYALLNGNRLAESSRASATTKKAGDWYLLSMLVTMPVGATGQTIEIGCVNDNAAAPANFDDFRLAPLVSSVTSNVYDPHSNRVLYNLDNDNLFTHYEYTPTGRLLRVYKETLDGTGSGTVAQKLVKEYDYNYAQLHAPTWMTTAYRCKADSYGNYTGLEERQVADANPLNSPATPAKWEDNGGSATCSPPSCPFTDSGIPYRLRNNNWEQAQPNGSPDKQSCGSQSCQWIYHWVYGNGDNAGDTVGDCSFRCM